MCSRDILCAWRSTVANALVTVQFGVESVGQAMCRSAASGRTGRQSSAWRHFIASDQGDDPAGETRSDCCDHRRAKSELGIFTGEHSQWSSVGSFLRWTSDDEHVFSHSCSPPDVFNRREGLRLDLERWPRSECYWRIDSYLSESAHRSAVHSDQRRGSRSISPTRPLSIRLGNDRCRRSSSPDDHLRSPAHSLGSVARWQSLWASRRV